MTTTDAALALAGAIKAHAREVQANPGDADPGVLADGVWAAANALEFMARDIDRAAAAEVVLVSIAEALDLVEREW